MSSQIVDLSLRGPEAYPLARTAVDRMEARRVWFSMLNFELWLHLTADPKGELSREVERLLQEGEELTEAVAESLALRFLPRHKVTEDIRRAGDQLAHQLDSIGRSIATAETSNGAYAKTLDGAMADLDGGVAAADLERLVRRLSRATRDVRKRNGALEARLADSTQEVRRLREHLQRTRREAMTDGLTELPNRKAFEEALARACDDPESEPLTLAMLDIDHFKRFNDTWGHQTGDQVLRFVAGVLARTGASPRMAARYGGEEFALLFPGESAGQVSEILEALLGEVASRALRRRSTEEELGSVTISAGYAQRRPGESASVLLDRADTALYASKHRGRDRATDADDVTRADSNSRLVAPRRTA